MTEDEMIRKMGLRTWNYSHHQGFGTLVSPSYDSRASIIVGLAEAFEGDNGVVTMTPDEAEAFGLRLVAAAGMVRARQTTKEETSNE